MKNNLTLHDIQTESLSILKDVHRWCLDNKVMYSVGYGSLIGAIRHKGFIPWDDDIDILMPRKHYERFCREYQSEKYKLLSPELSENYYLAFARVFDTERTISESRVPWQDGENGVWIDVFPIDLVSDDRNEFEKHKKELQRKWAETAWGRQAKCNFNMSWPLGMNLKLFIKKVLTLNGYLARKQLDGFMKVAKSLIANDSKHWSQLACMDGYEWHKVEDFVYTVLKPFEDTEVMVMNGYDNVLRDDYGDYMKLPPVEQRIGHSDGFTLFYWK